MADDFSFLTDSDDDKAVEDLLSQALDHSVLEQIAAINCSSFPSDNLPSHLESRFCKLKSLPTTTTGAGARAGAPSKSKSLRPRSNDDSNLDEWQIPDMKKGFQSPSKSTKTPKSELEKKGLKSKPGTGSSDSESDLDLKWKSKSKSSSTKTPKSELEKKELKSRSRTDSSGSWTLSSPESRTPSPPPARRIGCLWCSPKKEKSVRRKRGNENHRSSSLSWGDDIELSMKEQKKMMKQAMKEEEKMNRAAEKIVKWAKQASSRMMDVSGLPDELSHFDDTK